MKRIKDEDFIRGDIPMTKAIIRSLVISFLELNPKDVLLDIGAGTGSISVQAALAGANVVAIEREAEGVDLIAKNKDKFGVDLSIIHGCAPDDLPDQQIDACFIGGSGGQLPAIFHYLQDHLKEGGNLCATFITLHNLNQFLQLLTDHHYQSIETHMVQASQLNHIGMLKGQNPIFLLKGVKNDSFCGSRSR